MYSGLIDIYKVSTELTIKHFNVFEGVFNQFVNCLCNQFDELI